MRIRRTLATLSFLTAVLVCIPEGGGAPPANGEKGETAVLLRFGTRTFTLDGGSLTRGEGYALVMLGSCTFGGGPDGRAKEHWDAAMKTEHLLVRYPEPRPLAVAGEPETVEVREILVAPSEGGGPPKYVLARSGDKVYAYAKYRHEDWAALQMFLESLRPRESE